MQGGFPIDLILFGMVAAFLVLRLRSVLGKRQGFERPPQDQQQRPSAAYGPRPMGPDAELPQPAQPVGGPRRIVPDPRSPVGQNLLRIRGADAKFDPVVFLAGAEGAFRMIVDAFARGDRITLRNLLSDETYAGFEQAITRREQAGETQRTELRDIPEMAIEAADLRGTIADITVRFVSDQVNLTMARDGSVTQGAEAVTELTDIWTFQRDVASHDPAWRLTATATA